MLKTKMQLKRTSICLYKKLHSRGTTNYGDLRLWKGNHTEVQYLMSIEHIPYRNCTDSSTLPPLQLTFQNLITFVIQ